MDAENCVFCKIVRGQILSRKIYEDAEIFAFHDIHPLAPVHFMIIPKKHIDSLADCELGHQAILGKILAMAPRLAREQGSAGGVSSARPCHRRPGSLGPDAETQLKG